MSTLSVSGESSAAGLLNLETRARWSINCITLFRVYSLDLTSGEGKKKIIYKKFLLSNKALFQMKIISPFPVGILNVLIVQALDKTQALTAYPHS